MIRFLCHVFFFNHHVYIIYLWSWYCKVVRFVISSLLVLWSLFVNISIPKSLYIYCFIFYIDIYYDYMYLLLGHVVFFVYYYSSNGNLPIKHRKSDLAKNYDVIDEISDYHKHFLSISAISISVYSVCLCMYNYYVHVHTHKIDSTSPVNQKLGTLFFFIV